ncbi:MAG: hypothetical protein WCG27_07615 [Pseudomonadota bacterium]
MTRLIFLLLFLPACSHTLFTKDLNIPEGFYLAHFPGQTGPSTYSLYLFGEDQGIVCQLDKTPDSLINFMSQEKIRLALSWKERLRGEDTQHCFAVQGDYIDGEEKIYQQFIELKKITPHQIFCANEYKGDHCFAAIKSLQGTNLSVHEVGELFCRSPYYCDQRADQILIKVQ